ncbi:hypothetical protein CR513_01441, partial [Mucuna pruriens]
MEHTIENVEQQNLDLRGEMGQMKEQINKIFKLLTQGATLNAAVAMMPIYPPGFAPLYLNVYPYGMPSGWKANVGEQPTAEGHEQVGMNNSGTRPTQGSGTGPYTRSTPRPQKTTFLGEENLGMLEERLRIIEGTDSHELDTVDLGLVPDVVLPADFKMPKFEKYIGSSCSRVHLAMYCRKMASYIHQDKILVHYFQDNLTGQP